MSLGVFWVHSASRVVEFFVQWCELYGLVKKCLLCMYVHLGIRLGANFVLRSSNDMKEAL